MKQGKKIYSITTTSTPNNPAQRISATSMNLLSLYTTTKLPPVGRYYMCFQNDGKNAQAAKCVKSRITTKFIDSILSVYIFEQKCVVLKGVLQSLRLKDHVKNIGINQSLSNNDIF